MSLQSSAEQVVRVSLGERSYDIRIGAGVLQRAPKRWREQWDVRHAAILCDAAVMEVAQGLRDALLDAGLRADLAPVPSGETSKSVSRLSEIWDWLQSIKADRRSLLVAVGGGVVGDLGGFAAATYLRGLRFVQIPTTLLAQVDSSVGGKTGINLAGGKNLVGAFWQPAAVEIDPSTLDTLAEREFLSGMAEVVKYGVILDESLFDRLEREVVRLRARDSELLAEIIATCCRAKASVVERDELELTGLRAILNYGHTFGHAFENWFGYGQFLHGEAVSMGMVCAARLAVRLGMIPESIERRQEALLKGLGLPVRLPALDVPQVMSLMTRDKKVVHGKLSFVLPTRLGQVVLRDDVDGCQIETVLGELMERT